VSDYWGYKGRRVDCGAIVSRRQR